MLWPLKADRTKLNLDLNIIEEYHPKIFLQTKSDPLPQKNEKKSYIMMYNDKDYTS